MSQNVPTTAKEHVSVDNLPTGNVELLIRRHEMPDKLLVSRYWNGMEKPEQLIYVPERTCHVEGFDDGVDEGLDGEWYRYAPPTWYLSCGHHAEGVECPKFCHDCGAKVVDE